MSAKPKRGPQKGEGGRPPLATPRTARINFRTTEAHAEKFRALQGDASAPETFERMVDEARWRKQP